MPKFSPFLGMLPLLAAVSASAATLPYQGVATDTKGVPLADASYAVTFNLYGNAASATALWTEAQSVSTHKGLFSVSLGAVDSIPTSLFSNSPLYLGVTFPGGSELTPRLALAVVPWSTVSGRSDTARAAHRADSAKYATGVLDSVAGLRNTITSLNGIVANQATSITSLKTSIAALAALLTPSLPWNPSIQYGTFTDPRDGQVYRSVRIGSQVWMAQNLAYAGAGSSCAYNSADSCTKYGLIYDWATAMGLAGSYDTTIRSPTLPLQGVCPTGWHLPSQAEWLQLRDTLTARAGSGKEGKALKDSLGWVNLGGAPSVGNDLVGFRALPAQQYAVDPTGSRYDFGTGMTYFWSATETSAQVAVQVFLFAGDGIYFGNISPTIPNAYKTFRDPVRCVGN